MQKSHAYLSVSFLIAAVLVLNILQAKAVPLSYESERIPTIDEFMQLLRNSYEAQSKRTVGLGFDRGYSGQKTAQYLSGLDMAARMGRKRRSDEILKGEIDPLLRLHLLENAKRGLDFGFGRGFSGMQAARHLIGIEEANDATGPGRRRRNAGVTNTLAVASPSSSNDNSIEKNLQS